MNQKRGKKWGSRAVLPVLILLTFIVVFAGGFGLVGIAEAQFTIGSCADCHGNPPADGSARNTPAGAVVGSHVKHVTDQGIACTFCHGDTTSGGTDYAHRNGNIEMLATIHSGSGAYSKGTSFAQTNDLDGSGLGTCSNIYCHSNVQATNGTAAADTYASPQWGSGTLACDACHGQDPDETDGQPNSGSHNQHAGSQAGELNYTCTVCHNNGGDGNSNHANDTLNMDIDNTYGATAAYSQGDHTPGSGGYGNCTTSYCHGSGSPAWGTDLSTYDTCTKCHGENAALPTEAQKAPGDAGTDTNGDSAATDAQVGAHQAHMTLASGYTDVLNASGNCNECHIVPSAVGDAGHIDSDLPAEVFPGTINPDKADLNSVVPSYSAGACTVYCHGADMPNSTDNATPPVWTDTSLMTGTPDLAGDCSKCHEAPPASLSPHTGSETLSDCDTCHVHFNNDGTLTAGANRALHINGVVDYSADCDSCHAYPPFVGDGKTAINPEGKSDGAHAKHVNHIIAVDGLAALNATSDTYQNHPVCGYCHDTTIAGNHRDNDVDMKGPQYTTLFDAALKFGASDAIYNGTVGSDHTATLKTCSNIACHFTTTPEWQSY
ncbi:MAG: CxxxxCH/CxxCH domain-containing protein [Nitrospiraceae bacterium]|nr:MAG: CxxxxCH/CxxCH domain-containing protein [Nitrospiraceae bacterium]